MKYAVFPFTLCLLADPSLSTAINQNATLLPHALYGTVQEQALSPGALFYWLNSFAQEPVQQFARNAPAMLRGSYDGRFLMNSLRVISAAHHRGEKNLARKLTIGFFDHIRVKIAPPQWRLFRRAFKLYRRVVFEGMRQREIVPSDPKKFMHWVDSLLTPRERQALLRYRENFLAEHRWILNVAHIKRVLKGKEKFDDKRLWRRKTEKDDIALGKAYDRIIRAGLAGLHWALNGAGVTLGWSNLLPYMWKSMKGAAQEAHGILDVREIVSGRIPAMLEQYGLEPQGDLIDVLQKMPIRVEMLDGVIHVKLFVLTAAQEESVARLINQARMAKVVMAEPTKEGEMIVQHFYFDQPRFEWKFPTIANVAWNRSTLSHRTPAFSKSAA